MTPLTRRREEAHQLLHPHHIAVSLARGALANVLGAFSARAATVRAQGLLAVGRVHLLAYAGAVSEWSHITARASRTQIQVAERHHQRELQ